MDMDRVITADAGIITGGAEVVATTMVGGIIATTGNLIVCSERPPGWRPLFGRKQELGDPSGIEVFDLLGTGNSFALKRPYRTRIRGKSGALTPIAARPSATA
jgi:hypothetical protein